MQDNGAIVVTGASTGIGAGCALRLAELGYHVYAGIRQTEDGARLKEQTKGVITPLYIDVTDVRSVKTAAETVAADVGDRGVWGLVNNAGVVVAGPLEFVSLDALRRQLEINVIGQMAVTQAFLPMLRVARGRIVNMGSIAGIMATPFVGPYGASKHAMEALSDVLRFEVAPWGIQVSLVEPGAIKTPIWKKSEQAALSLVESAGGQVGPLYGNTLDVFQRGVNKVAAMALPVEKVVAVVEHDLTARRPKTRYLVGFDARVQAWLRRWLPDRLRDYVVRKALGMPN